MKKQSRIGDIGVGVCPCHKTPVSYITVFVTGARTVKVNNRREAYVTTIGVASCGHPTIALTGSNTFGTEFHKPHGVGDTGVNCGPYVTITGSSNVVYRSGGMKIVCSSIAPPSQIPGMQPWVTAKEAVGYMQEDELNAPYSPSELKTFEQAGVSPNTITPGTTNQEETVPSDKPPTTVDCTGGEKMTKFPPSFQLSPSYVLADLTTLPLVSTYTLKEQGGLTEADIVCNLIALCTNVLEPLKAKYGSEMVITSGFRVGSGSSQHYKGQAVDIQFPGKFSNANTKYLDRSKEIIALVPLDQFILEYGNSGPIFHISFNKNGNRPSSQAFKIATRPSLNNKSFQNGLFQLPS